MLWKKCPFGCVFQIDDSVWRIKSVAAFFVCPTCHRQSPPGQFTVAIGGAATQISNNAMITSQMAGGKKTDVLVKERMLRILTGLGFMESTKKTAVDNIYQRLVMLLMNAELTSNFPTPRIYGLLDSGEMKNMWAFAISDPKYAAERDAGERQVFGMLSEQIRNSEDPVASERPVYIVLNVGNLKQGGAAQYGHSYLVYRDAVKLRSTFLATDSLQMIRGEALIAPELRQGVGTVDVATYTSLPNVLLRVSDRKLKSLCSMAGGAAWPYVDEFIEAHGWGHVNIAEDVKAIVMSEPDLQYFALRGRDGDHRDIFPPELKGLTQDQKTKAVQALKTALTDYCARHNIQLYFMQLDINSRNSLEARPKLV